MPINANTSAETKPDTAAPAADSITILTAREFRLTKLIKPNPEGGIPLFDSYDKGAKHFDVEVMPLDGLDDVEAMYTTVRPCPSRCIVRGNPIDPSKTTGILRRSRGLDATLKPAAHRWILLDVENVPLPEGVNVTDLKSCALIAISYLPAEFQGVEFIAQFSSGHGLKPGIRMHLWFWGSRPTSDGELKAWLAAYPEVDQVIFCPSQPVYIADPMFSAGVKEHLPQRLLRVRCADRVVQVPAEIYISGSNRSVSSGGTDFADIIDIEEALAVIKPTGEPLSPANVHVGLGCFGASGGSDDAFEAWAAWHGASPEASTDSWERMQRSPPDAGWNTLRKYARAAVPGWWPTSDQFDAVEFTDEDKQLLIAMPGTYSGDTAHKLAADVARTLRAHEKPLQATPFSLIDYTFVPPRQWLYGKLLVRGYVSVLGAPGGAGKTALAVATVMSMASNRSLLGHHIHTRGRAWYYNLEDDREEMIRRLQAAGRYYSLSHDELDGWLFTDSGRDRDLIIAVKDERGTTVATPDVEKVIAEIQRLGVDVMVVDPFVRCHQLVENDNGDMDFAAKQWAIIASRTNCAILLVHHFRKGGVSGDPDAFRGGGGLINAARIAFTVGPMSEADAKIFGIPLDECWSYLRLDSAKANLAPRGKADWFRLVSYDLKNATEDYPDGDSVQVVKPWAPPSPTEGVSWDAIEQVLDAVEKGPEEGGQYSSAPNAKKNSAARAIAPLLGDDEAKAKRLIADLIKRGVLITAEYKNKDSKDVKGLQVIRSAVLEFKCDFVGDYFTVDDEQGAPAGTVLN